MNYVSLVLTALFAVSIIIGFIVGVIRGFKRSTVRAIWVVAIFVAMLLLSSKITLFILNFDISKIGEFTIEGQPLTTISELVVSLIQDALQGAGGDYAGLVALLSGIVTIAINALVFVITYFLLKLISLPFYWIINAIIFSGEKRKKRRAKKKGEKIKIKKHRLLGGLVGIIISTIGFCVTMTPVMGYMNLVKTAEKETAKNSEDGKGIVSQALGDDMYKMIMDGYDNSIPMKIFSTIKLDSAIASIFNATTTTTINGKEVSLNKEADNIIALYSSYTDLEIPNFNTCTKQEFTTFIGQIDNMVNLLFSSNLVNASSDALIPLAVEIVSQKMEIEKYKPYVQDMLTSVFEQFKTYNGETTKNDLKAVISLASTLNENDLLLPLIQDSEESKIEILQRNLTKTASDEVFTALFSISTINNLATDVVNFLLGFGGDQLGFEYTEDDHITSQVLKESLQTIAHSVIDVLANYNEEISTKVEINETTVGAVGAILDTAKNILNTNNFVSLVNSIEPKINDMINELMIDQPEFIANTLTSAISNLSKIESFETELTNAYSAIDAIMKEVEDAKDEDKIKLDEMDFAVIGESIDKISSSALFSNDLILTAMKGAIEYGADTINEQFSTQDDPFELTFDSIVLDNLDAMIEGDDFTWEEELPKYKKTFGIFANLMQTDVDIITKLRNEADTTLAELGVEFDGDLKNSALLGGADKAFVTDLLTIAKLSLGEGEDDMSASITTLFNDAIANISTAEEIVWTNEFGHIKSLITLNFETLDNDAIISIAEKIDSIIFGENKSTIFTQDMFNKLLVDVIDGVFGEMEEGDDLYNVVANIKDSFNNDITNYELEITALLKLTEVVDVLNDSFSFSTHASALGEKIDAVLAVGDTTVVTRGLINDYIKTLIGDLSTSVPEDFAFVIENITGTKTDDSFGTGRIDTMTSTYAKEFEYLAKLMDLDTTQDLVEVAEYFDANIAPSQLVGDALITPISDALNEYKTDNADYASILNDVVANYNYVKDYILWGTKTSGIPYEYIVADLNEITDFMTSFTGVDIDSFNGASIDESLLLFQGFSTQLESNLLMQINATNRLAKFIMEQVKEEVTGLKAELAGLEEEVAKVEKIENYATQYIAFLDMCYNDTNGWQNTYQPYHGATQPVYVHEVEDTNTGVSVWEQCTESDAGALRIDSPFAYVKALIDSITV